jgi:hypothetical protein
MALSWIQATSEYSDDALYLIDNGEVQKLGEKALAITNKHISLDGTQRTVLELSALLNINVIDNEACLYNVNTEYDMAYYIGSIALEAGRKLAYFVLTTTAPTNTYAIVVNMAECFCLLFNVAQGIVMRFDAITPCMQQIGRSCGTLYACRISLPPPLPPKEEVQQQQQQQQTVVDIPDESVTKKKPAKKIPTATPKKRPPTVVETQESSTKKAATVVTDLTGSAEETHVK